MAKKPTTPEESLMEFIKTVEDTGGVKLNAKGLYEPQADPEWIDLGDAYVNACEVLKRKPMVEEEEIEEDGESEESKER